MCVSDFKVCDSETRQMMFVLSAAKLTNECLQEGVECTVNFPDDDPKVIARLILFLYTNHYPHNYLPLHEADSRSANETWFKGLRTLLSASDDNFIHKTDAESFNM